MLQAQNPTIIPLYRSVCVFRLRYEPLVFFYSLASASHVQADGRDFIQVRRIAQLGAADSYRLELTVGPHGLTTSGLSAIPAGGDSPIIRWSMQSVPDVITTFAPMVQDTQMFCYYNTVLSVINTDASHTHLRHPNKGLNTFGRCSYYKCPADECKRTKLCTGCSARLYCSVDCQHADHDVHSKACRSDRDLSACVRALCMTRASSTSDLYVLTEETQRFSTIHRDLLAEIWYHSVLARLSNTAGAAVDFILPTVEDGIVLEVDLEVVCTPRLTGPQTYRQLNYVTSRLVEESIGDWAVQWVRETAPRMKGKDWVAIAMRFNVRWGTYNFTHGVQTLCGFECTPHNMTSHARVELQLLLNTWRKRAHKLEND
ncbi:hypothetical protein B0H10DRAFT_1284094 [Mycena sp. CBHHK59/15]|nr:hypothetical protein B0H10DRAFT_1284094 [Mycena sp. CBHHK59/15]